MFSLQPTLFTILATISIVLLVLLLYIWSAYNTFVVKRNQVKTDFSDILVQFRRKTSLIETLASLVKDYAQHEKGTFEQVALARSAIDTTKTAHEGAKTENILKDTLRSLFAVVENYPKLQASENFQGLRDDLKETENQIAAYREGYNLTVQEYNNLVQTFPNLLVATLFNFLPEELFEETPKRK